MKLRELLFTSYIISQIDSASYAAFLNQVNQCVNINRVTHRQELLNWLRSWGMRNLTCKADEQLSQQLHNWYSQQHRNLPQPNTTIWDLSDTSLKRIQIAYEELTGRQVNCNKRRVSFGQVGAAKILFALRPHALPLWDGAIRDSLVANKLIVGDTHGKMYFSFMCYIRDVVIPDLKNQCKKAGFALADLPRWLNRDESITVLKLIDEYFWVTFTRNISPPSAEMLRHWAKA